MVSREAARAVCELPEVVGNLGIVLSADISRAGNIKVEFKVIDTFWPTGTASPSPLPESIIPRSSIL